MWKPTLTMVLVAATLLGQAPRRDWPNLNRMFEPGTRVRLDLSKGRLIEGVVTAVTESGVSLVRGRESRSFDRAEIARAYVLSPVRSHRRLWIGALIGGGISGGMCIAFAANSKFDLTCNPSAAVVAIGTGAGALLGHVSRKKFEPVLVYDKYE